MSTQDQLTAFKAGLSSASHKLHKRVVVAPTTSSPSPAPSSAPSSEPSKELKRKRETASSVPYSQPADTGYGSTIPTQATYAANYLKSKGIPLTFGDILSYLSLHNKDTTYKELLRRVVVQHGKVIYDPKGLGGKGSYAFRPKYEIRNANQLLAYLQSQTTAAGLPVKDLLEGWPDAEDGIRKLENEHKVLVIRNKKDDHARTVWIDDPSLAQRIDTEFANMWHKIKLPDSEALRVELEKSGLLPANKSQMEATKPKNEEKKKKKTRKGGKTTNTHLSGVLKDYSETKRR